MTVDVNKDYNDPILAEDDGTLRVKGWNSDGDCDILPDSLIGKTKFAIPGATAVRSNAERAADTISTKDKGAKGDGSTDDTAAVQAALNAAAGRRVTLPGVHRIAGQVTVPINTVLAESRIVMDTDGRLILSNYSGVINCHITDTTRGGFTPIIHIPSFVIRARIENNYISGAIPVWLNQCISATVAGNALDSTSYGVYFDGNAKHNIVKGNNLEVRGGWGIQLVNAASFNVIDGNMVEGFGLSVAGIILLETSFSLVGNQITSNKVKNFTEEGISTDITSTANAVHCQAASVSRSGGYDVLTVDGGTVAAATATRYCVLIMSGSRKGHAVQILACDADNVLKCPEWSLDGVADGDEVTVACCALDTLISGNSVDSCKRTGIMAYGTVSGSLIDGNRVTNCGSTADVEYLGHVTYKFAGITAIGISQAVGESKMGRVIIQRNYVSGCRNGITTGRAHWDGAGLIYPAQVKILDNEVVGCQSDYGIDAGYSPVVVKTEDDTGVRTIVSP